jgi:hypothetical protein
MIHKNFNFLSNTQKIFPIKVKNLKSNNISKELSKNILKTNHSYKFLKNYLQNKNNNITK